MSEGGGMGNTNMADPRLRYTLSAMFISAYLQSRATEVLRMKRVIFPSYPFGPSNGAKHTQVKVTLPPLPSKEGA